MMAYRHASQDELCRHLQAALDAGRTPVSVRSLRPLSLERLPAQLIRSSPYSLGLCVSQFLAPGSLMQVRIGNSFVFGEVRCCAVVEGSFHAEVLIEEITVASRRPGHTPR